MSSRNRTVVLGVWLTIVGTIAANVVSQPFSEGVPNWVSVIFLFPLLVVVTLWNAHLNRNTEEAEQYPVEQERNIFHEKFLCLLSIGIATIISTMLVLTLRVFGGLDRLEELLGDVSTRLQSESISEIDTSFWFAFIDIDNAAFSRWGTRLLTPRGKLQKLISFAVESCPRLILMDVDLSLASGPDGQSSEDDRILYDFLKEPSNFDRNILKCPYPHRTKYIPVILQREIVFGSDWNEKGIGQEQRSAFLEQVVEESCHLTWASTLFQPSTDGIIRHWSGSVGEVPPAVCLVREHVARTDSSESCARQSRRCSATATRPQRLEFPIRCSAEGHCSSPRAVFSTSNADPGHLLSVVPALHAVSCDGHHVGVSASECNTFRRSLRDRIVVIGGTYAAARDWHVTPVGPMPGAIILINALHTDLQDRSTYYYEFLFTFVVWSLMVGVIYVFMFYYRILFPALAVIVFIIPINLIISFYRSDFNLWISPTLMAVGLLFYRPIYIALKQSLDWIKRRSKHATS